MPSEQGYRGSYVLTCLSKVREAFVILDDPLVYVVGDGACAATIPAMLDLAFELRELLLQLEARIFELLVPHP